MAFYLYAFGLWISCVTTMFLGYGASADYKISDHSRHTFNTQPDVGAQMSGEGGWSSRRCLIPTGHQHFDRPQFAAQRSDQSRGEC